MRNVRPNDWHNPQPAGRYDLIVLGAGTAGLSAARMAAMRGKKVALIERDLLGGTSLNTGCLPSKTIIRTSRLYGEMRHAENYGVSVPADIQVDFPAAMLRMRRIRAHVSRLDSARDLAASGVDVFFGVARFCGADAVMLDGTRLRFKRAVIATGAHPKTPAIPGLVEAGYFTNESIFDLTELPRRILVIGGGPLGCEMAQAFCRFGAQTTIVQNWPLFLPREERDAAQILSDAFASDGIEIRLDTRVVNVRVQGDEKIVDLVHDDYKNSITVDAILTGTGRAPNVDGLDLEAAGVAYDSSRGVHVDDFLRTANARIYAAGDVCLEHKFDDTAEASARIVVENALFHGRQRLSRLTIPWCTYTDPEIAHVGLYVRQAREQGISVKTFTVPMHEVDRAIADGEETGFVKIHVREDTDEIVGATIVARHAGEMISELTLAIVAGIGLRKLATVIHPYPTQAGAIRQAADAYERTRIAPS
ncbi:MAG: mercuric reductase [Gemmatimonadota bacterium]|nr:mercuric reductase [Gemmatimonadota bacterium]